MAKDRDEKGRFIKGKVPEGSTPFCAGTAQEMQARSAAARKRNTTLRETMLRVLQEDAGDGMTHMEKLARKAMSNHEDVRLSFGDLRSLSSLLGEDVINVKTEGSIRLIPKDEEQARLLAKYITPDA